MTSLTPLVDAGMSSSSSSWHVGIKSPSTLSHVRPKQAQEAAALRTVIENCRCWSGDGGRCRSDDGGNVHCVAADPVLNRKAHVKSLGHLMTDSTLNSMSFCEEKGEWERERERERERES